MKIFEQFWQYIIYIGVKQVNRFCVWLYRFVEQFAKGQIEPPDSVWVSEITLCDGKNEERYSFPITAQAITVSNNNKWSLFIVKNIDFYLFRTSPSTIDFFPTKSNISFLYVEYTHMKMTSPVELTIPSSYLYDKNEIFSEDFFRINIHMAQTQPYSTSFPFVPEEELEPTPH